MDFENPSRLFVVVDGVLAPRVFRSFYRGYASSIDLCGDEAVLEFGCGSGGIAEYLIPRLPQGSLTCIDICPPMLRIAKKRLRSHPNARCLLGRIETLRLPDASYDLVVIHNALHDIPEEERSATLAELVRVLKPGGRLALREPTKPSHGMPPAAYREAVTGVGLFEYRACEYKVFPVGPVFDSIFIKPG